MVDAARPGESHTDDDRSVLMGAFEALRPRLLAFATLRVGTAAEDIVQDTLVAALARARQEGFDGVASPAAWLYGILRHKIVDHHRRGFAGSSQLGRLDVAARAPERHEASVPFTTEDVMMVRQVLARLPPRHYLILLLNQRAGLTTAEIARIVKLSPGRTGAILADAKERFRRGVRGEENG